VQTRMSAMGQERTFVTGTTACPETKDRTVSSILNQIVIDDMAC